MPIARILNELNLRSIRQSCQRKHMETEVKDQQEKQDMMQITEVQQVFISTSWQEGSIWIGSTPKKVDDFTSLDSIGQKVVQYIHSERENLMKEKQKLQNLMLNQMKDVKERSEKKETMELENQFNQKNHMEQKDKVKDGLKVRSDVASGLNLVHDKLDNGTQAQEKEKGTHSHLVLSQKTQVEGKSISGSPERSETPGRSQGNKTLTNNGKNGSTINDKNGMQGLQGQVVQGEHAQTKDPP